MKVLITTDWYAPVVNGVVASVLTLQHELEALGCEVRILTLAEGRRSVSEGSVYRIASVSAGMFYQHLRIGMRMNHEILEEILEWAPDVVHSQCEFSTYAWARKVARTLDVPLLHTYHTIYENYTHYYSPSKTVGRKMVAAFSRRVLDRADQVVAPTQKVADLLVGYGVSRPISVCPTGLDLSRFEPVSTPEQAQDRVELRRELGVPDDHLVLVSVCRLAKEKNLDEVLRRFAGVVHLPVTLVLVGHGPYAEELQDLAGQLGITDRVRFVGGVAPDQVGRYYRAGDMFVSASQSETQGLTYIEALACGVGLLCLRDACLDGVVLHGVNGWQFSGASEFNRYVEALVEDRTLAARLGRNGAEFAHAQCSARQFARSVLDAYRESMVARAMSLSAWSPALLKAA